MSANDQILTEVDGFIGRFTINNAAKRNCMTLSMWQRMGDVFAAWADDPEVRVIIVRGAGEQCFCAGNDISEFAELRSSPENIANYTAVTDRAYALFKAVPKPTIARIAGFCIGGGLEMAQLCDIQIAADTATFGVTPAKLGLGYKLNDVQLLTDNVGAKVRKGNAVNHANSRLMTRSDGGWLIELWRNMTWMRASRAMPTKLPPTPLFPSKPPRLSWLRPPRKQHIATRYFARPLSTLATKVTTIRRASAPLPRNASLNSKEHN